MIPPVGRNHIKSIQSFIRKGTVVTHTNPRRKSWNKVHKWINLGPWIFLEFSICQLKQLHHTFSLINVGFPAIWENKIFHKMFICDTPHSFGCGIQSIPASVSLSPPIVSETSWTDTWDCRIRFSDSKISRRDTEYILSSSVTGDKAFSIGFIKTETFSISFIKTEAFSISFIKRKHFRYV